MVVTGNGGASRISSYAIASRIASRRGRRRTRGEEVEEEEEKRRQNRLVSPRMSVEPQREFGSVLIDIVGTYRQGPGIPQRGRGRGGGDKAGSVFRRSAKTEVLMDRCGSHRAVLASRLQA